MTATTSRGKRRRLPSMPRLISSHCTIPSKPRLLLLVTLSCCPHPACRQSQVDFFIVIPGLCNDPRVKKKRGGSHNDAGLHRGTLTESSAGDIGEKD